MEFTKSFKTSRTLRSLMLAVLMLFAEMVGFDYQLFQFNELAKNGLSVAEIGQILATGAGAYFRFIAKDKLV